MVWDIDLSGKAIVVTGGNRVCLGLLPSERLLSNRASDGRSVSRSHKVSVATPLRTNLIVAGGHVAIVYRSSEDAPERAKEIEEKFHVRSKVSETSSI